MIDQTALVRIGRDQQFRTLVAQRRRFTAWLTGAVLLPYYAYVLVASFAPGLLGTKVAPGSAVNIGWPIGVALIVSAWLLTGLYVRRANNDYDALIASIVKGASK